MLRNRSRTLA